MDTLIWRLIEINLEFIDFLQKKLSAGGLSISDYILLSSVKVRFLEDILNQYKGRIQFDIIVAIENILNRHQQLTKADINCINNISEGQYEK